MVNYTFHSNDSFNFIKCGINYFIQYYYTQQTENAIREDASRISHLVEQADNKTLAIEHSQQLIDGSGGVIIMANKSSSIKSSNSNTKDKMLEEIHKNSQFQRVFSQGKSTTQKYNNK